MQCSWFDSGYMFLPVFGVMGSFTYFLREREQDLTGTVLGLVVDALVVVQRQVPWFRQYRIPWRFRSWSLVNR